MLSEPVQYNDTCEQHGPYVGNKFQLGKREILSGCPECAKLRQAERDAQDKAEQERNAANAARARLEAKLTRAAIPLRFADKTFDTYHAETDRQKKALSVCKAYATDFERHIEDGRCLMLMGKPGCGKTHLAAAISGHICRETKYSAVYRTLPGLIADIRSTYNDESEYTEAGIIQTVTRCGLLILDEIGATKSSEFELSLLFNIINTRYEDKLPTVIASNLPPSELKGAIGERCVDRLREGGGIVIGFDWESKRGSL